jgi:hypothetical protein
MARRMQVLDFIGLLREYTAWMLIFGAVYVIYKLLRALKK